MRFSPSLIKHVCVCGLAATGWCNCFREVVQTSRRDQLHFPWEPHDDIGEFPFPRGGCSRNVASNTLSVPIQGGAIAAHALSGLRVLEIKGSTFVANGPIEAEAQAQDGATETLFCMNSAEPELSALGVEPDDECSAGRFTCAQIVEWGYGEGHYFNVQETCQSLLNYNIFLFDNTLINAPDGVTGTWRIAEVCPAECSAPVVTQVSCFCDIAVYLCTVMAITECWCCLAAGRPHLLSRRERSH
jgi:hypothetical protein